MDCQVGQKKYESVAEALRMRIASECHQGQMFPPEVELAESFGVSVTTIRKSLEILVGEGLIERRQGKGTTVLLSLIHI